MILSKLETDIVFFILILMTFNGLTGCVHKNQELFQVGSEEVSYMGLSETPADHPNILEPTDNKINLYADFSVEEVDR